MVEGMNRAGEGAIIAGDGAIIKRQGRRAIAKSQGRGIIIAGYESRGSLIKEDF